MDKKMEVVFDVATIDAIKNVTAPGLIEYSTLAIAILSFVLSWFALDVAKKIRHMDMKISLHDHFWYRDIFIVHVISIVRDKLDEAKKIYVSALKEQDLAAKQEAYNAILELINSELVPAFAFGFLDESRLLLLEEECDALGVRLAKKIFANAEVYGDSSIKSYSAGDDFSRCYSGLVSILRAHHQNFVDAL